MLNTKKSRRSYFLSVIAIAMSIMFSACSKDNNPVDVNGAGTSKVSGRVTGDQGLYKSLQKSSGVESSHGVTGAAVILAQVQADGSLKTVSTQSVQTDVNGNFTVETNLSGAQNLVVVATKGTSQWKTVVYSQVSSNTTVYCQPVNTQTTAQANVYAQLVVSGKANTISTADLQMYLTSSVAAQINSNTTAESQFASSLATEAQVRTQAASQAYFGISNAQLQTIENAKLQALASFQTSLYNNVNSQSSVSQDFQTYQRAYVTAYTNSNVKLETYATLLRISSRAYMSQSAQMSSNASFSASQSINAHSAFVIRNAVETKFQAAGASSAQISAVTNAGAALSASIASATTINQISDAYVQYHNTVAAQLKVVLSAYASSIDTIDATINSTGGAKAILNAALSVSASSEIIINTYVTFFNSIKTLSQTSLVGATSAQVDAATQIFILANMN